MNKPKIIELDSAESVICPICGHFIIPENGEETEISPSDMCEHVVGIEFNGELQEDYGWPETEQWWAKQQELCYSDSDVEVEEPSLENAPGVQFIVRHGEICGPYGSISTIAFGMPDRSS
mgnify:CR=1 FL=1